MINDDYYVRKMVWMRFKDPKLRFFIFVAKSNCNKRRDVRSSSRNVGSLEVGNVTTLALNVATSP